ncbi:MAG TPA: hypothetical protein DCE44_16000, partial [Verrucomicrobiales bacterium]|nr:hypothetical protein [Verrucomicrobiales bacterium]
MLACLVIGYLRLEAGQQRWVAPAPSGLANGLTALDPAGFSSATVNAWLADSSLSDLEIIFKAGDYTVTEPSIILQGNLSRAITLRGESGGTRPHLILGSIQNSSTYSPYWTKGVAHHWLIRNGTDSTARSYYLKRIIVDNLDLDGNFSGQGAWTSEANATGYKSFALDLAAES